MTLLLLLLGPACREIASDPCGQEPDPQAETRCRIGEASHAAGAGDLPGAESQCQAVEALGGKLAKTWSGECWFRAGEEFARRGRVADGLRMCARAGKHARSCVTHATWGGKLDGSSTADLAAWIAQVADVAESEDELRAAWWNQRVVGSGRADPALARTAAGPDATYARTTWAQEALRLASGDVARVRASWDADEVLTGQALGPEEPFGRYHPWMATEGEEAIPKVRIYSGSRRLVGGDAEEDLDIALVEALHYIPSVPASALVPYLSDPRARVRYTALRLYRVTPSPETEGTVRSLAGDDDPVIRAHVASAILHQTWLGPRPPGGKEPGPTAQPGGGTR